MSPMLHLFSFVFLCSMARRKSSVTFGIVYDKIYLRSEPYFALSKMVHSSFLEVNGLYDAMPCKKSEWVLLGVWSNRTLSNVTIGHCPFLEKDAAWRQLCHFSYCWIVHLLKNHYYYYYYKLYGLNLSIASTNDCWNAGSLPSQDFS